MTNRLATLIIHSGNKRALTLCQSVHIVGHTACFWFFGGHNGQRLPRALWIALFHNIETSDVRRAAFTALAVQLFIDDDHND